MAEDMPTPDIDPAVDGATDTESGRSVRATGLEGSGFWWKTLHENPPPEPILPFRRGRIWA